MKPLAITWVLLVGVVSAALSFLGFFAHMRTGGTPMIVTPGPRSGVRRGHCHPYLVRHGRAAPARR